MWDFKKFDNLPALLSEEGEQISYASLHAAGKAMAPWLPKRSLVFCLCKNSIGSLQGYVAFLNAGVVPLLLDAKTDPLLVMRLCEVYRPDLFWIPTELLGHFPQTELVYSSRDYCLLRTALRRDDVLHPDLALLLTTSGSTGSRKIVRLSSDALRSNFEAISAYLELDSTQRAITTLPMNYTYGLSIIHSHLHVGASISMTEKTLIQKEFWQQLRSQQVTCLGGVPFTYEMMNKLRVFDMDLPSLQTLTQAGGKLSASLHQKFADFAASTGRRFYVMYGQTEATARMAYLPAQQAAAQCGSIGIAIPGGQLSLCDDSGQEINDADVTGNLVYRGPNVMLGYAEDRRDLSKGDELHGILHTGDRARRDAQGYFYLTGRNSRFLKVFGSRVSLDDLEQLVKDNFSTLDVACCGQDDAIWIFVTCTGQNDEIKRYLSDRAHLPPSAISIKTVESIPKNESGKVLYQELMRLGAA